MAGSSLLTLLDDITTLLDDVSVMTKLATKKTAGVLGDDLALNAQQVTGIKPSRELPVVWAVAKGSLVNKAILVPAALAISAFSPWAIPYLMMIGGAFLCYEGVEKLAHKYLHPAHEDESHREANRKAVAGEPIDLVAFEKERIKGAIRTDFILSAEIIVLSLGVVSGEPFVEQVLTLVAIALLMTVGVYGLVGGIVKLDDVGLWLSQRGGALAKTVGGGLLAVVPWLMKGLSIAGTAAMFLVGGGIIVHNIGALHHFIEPFAHGGFGWLVSALYNAAVGIVVGALALLAVGLFSKLRKPKAETHS